MRQELQDIINGLCKDLFDIEIKSIVDRPEKKFGDYTSNIAMQLAGKLGKPPLEIANEIAKEIKKRKEFKSIEVVRPGFINFSLLDKDLIRFIYNDVNVPSINVGKEILVEYGDPNPFKDMHLGHLYTTVVGDTISSVLKASGADVKSLSYHGDVGLNIAKAIYGIGEYIDWDISLLSTINKDKTLGYFYAEGEKSYKPGSPAEEKIKYINASVYNRQDKVINAIYDFGRKLSFDNFEEIFKKIGAHFDKSYFESESAKIGLKIVMDNLGKVFEKSEGAIIYRGEDDGLYTSVFINSQGLPTYQAKDLGLTKLKENDFPNADRSIIITANEQSDYFRVLLVALAKIDNDLAEKTTHISHGFISLVTGKMSSRTGNVFKASDLIDLVQGAVDKQYSDSKTKEEIFIAALRYSFVRQRIGPDIVFDPKESVAIEGNSGPYIQYAHARARSIIKKSNSKSADKVETDLLDQERDMVVMFDKFYDAFEAAVNDYMPHHICTYLYQLAQEFNRFYEKNRVIGDPRESIRMSIVKKYADILRFGLDILHIPAPSYM